MGIRRAVGQRLEAALGRERTNAIRRAERSGRNALAKRIAVPSAPAAKAAAAPVAPKPAASKRRPSDPFVPHPKPRMSRHTFLRGLHEQVQPRTYLEIGINDGASMALSRTRSIGVDPAFHVDKPIHCDVQLIRATSDDFFAADDAVAHFGGVPVDLGFIDGMHLSEFALRDFINLEPLMARSGVVVFDDILPRNPLEAARDRKTQFWTGDVYKAVEVLARRRPDLVIILINTQPTGTAVVVSLDPTSTVMRDAYDAEVDYLLKTDPQSPPQAYMDRSISVEPDVLLASPAWAKLLSCRDAAEPGELTAVWDELRAIRRV